MSAPERSAVVSLLFTHAPVADLQSATGIARALLSRFDTVAPDHGWRAEEHAEPVSVDRLADLAFPDLVDSYAWGIVSGDPPRDLYVSMSIGSDGGIRSWFSARLRFADHTRFEQLEQIYQAMTTEPTLEWLILWVGPAFLLDQRKEDPQGRLLLPELGWRTRFPRPPGVEIPPLPDWVTVETTSTHIEFTLGPDPYDITPHAAGAIRDTLVDHGILKPLGPAR